MKWPHLAAKSRISIADALATLTPALVTTTRGMPGRDVLRAALYGWAFNAERRAAGEPAAATVVARKRAVFYSVLNYAVELDIVPANPIDKVRWKAPRTADVVDRRVVASHSRAQRRRPCPGAPACERSGCNWPSRCGAGRAAVAIPATDVQLQELQRARRPYTQPGRRRVMAVAAINIGGTQIRAAVFAPSVPFCAADAAIQV